MMRFHEKRSGLVKEVGGSIEWNRSRTGEEASCKGWDTEMCVGDAWADFILGFPFVLIDDDERSFSGIFLSFLARIVFSLRSPLYLVEFNTKASRVSHYRSAPGLLDCSSKLRMSVQSSGLFSTTGR